MSYNAFIQRIVEEATARGTRKRETRRLSCAVHLRGGGGALLANCSNCGRRLEWRDTTKTDRRGVLLLRLGGVGQLLVSAWCGRDIADRDSSADPLKAQRGSNTTALPVGLPAAA